MSGAARHFLNTAAIIPGLYNENPLALLEALRIAECQYSGSIEGPLARLIYPLFETMYLTTTASGVMWGQSITAPRPWGLDTPLGQAGAGSNAPGGWRPDVIRVGGAIISGALLAVGGLMLWDALTREQEQVERIQPEMRPWRCMTNCSVIGPTPPCGFHIRGIGIGSTRDGACNAAISDANSQLTQDLFSSGCRLRHCTPCDCIK